MRQKILVFSCIILVMSIFIARETFAECREGKTEVTIVNPAGKVITICVPEHVVDNIGGPNDIVIPAACPCFTPESIDEYARELPPDPTRLCLNSDDPYKSTTALSDSVPTMDYATFGTYSHSPVNSGHCQHWDETYSIFNYEDWITYEEVSACRAILLNSDMWALNCESP